MLQWRMPLAFEDAALARLAIAATAVPPHRRGRWLKKFADAAERPESKSDTVSYLPPPRRPKSGSTLRKDKTRARRRAGRSLYRLEIGDIEMEAVVDALVGLKWLREGAAMDQRALEHALSRVVVEFGRRWREDPR
jgi:hypothetical protein